MAKEPLPPPLAVGSLLSSRYRLEGVIGSGGMGVIVAAVDTETGGDVAVKLLRPGPDDAGRRERLEREARALRALEGEDVAKLLDVGVQPSGAPFLVMERLDGMSLAELADAAGHLPVERAVDLVLVAAVALDRAHQAGILHRDVKPSNLFLTKGAEGAGTLKVLDFGVAKVAGDAARSLTASTDRLGTARYMSPEQLTCPRDVTARTDIWSLGVVLFELLSGERPFEGDHDAAVAYAIVHGATPALHERRPDVPEGLARVVTRCLEKAPERRYASASALARALAPWASGTERARVEAAIGVASEVSAGDATLDGDGSSLVALTAQAPGREPTHASRGSRAVGIVALVVAVAAGAALLGRLSAPPPHAEPSRGDEAAASVPPQSAAPRPAETGAPDRPAPGPAAAETVPPRATDAAPTAAPTGAVAGTPPSGTPARARRPHATAADAAPPKPPAGADCPDPQCSRN